jgi:serine/threonine protein kinase
LFNLLTNKRFSRCDISVHRMICKFRRVSPHPVELDCRQVSPTSTFEGQRCCIACSKPVNADRCGWCGVALAAGGFTVEHVLAQGAQGRVYRARDDEGCAVALKELLFAAVPDTAQIDAFEREAATLKTLTHPAIPRFIRSFSEGNGVNLRLYLASELIEGESLASRIRRAPLSESELLTLARQALAVLAYLHDRSPPVIHRDIKPDNLLIKPDGKLVLVDFGSARRISGPRTYTSTLVGTFGYMPLEQLGGTVDRTSDLYALGATLLHAATGKPPSELLADEYGLRIPIEVPARLRPVIERMVRVRPEQRFANAEQVLKALEDPSASSQPKTHPKPGATERAWRKPAVALIAIFGLVLLGGEYFPRLSAEVFSIPTEDSKSSRSVPRSAAATWFATAKPFCNSVEVSQFLARSKPPGGWEGAGYQAGCYALAGRIEPARQLISKLNPDEQWRAAGIVFDLAHGVADSGDDVAASPIMKMVLAFWPNHYQAMYHAGMSDYALGDYASAKLLLESFLNLYHQEDGFRHNAQQALARIDQGLRPESAHPGMHE